MDETNQSAPVSATGPRVETQDSVISGQPKEPDSSPALNASPRTAPTAAPASAPALQAAPPVAATSPNGHLHNFIGRVLTALAGPAPANYDVDHTTGRLVASSRQESPSQKIRRITSNALIGLSAGAEIPQQKSGLANALAGLGAGAAAVSGKRSADEALSKEEARKNFEAEQKVMLQKYEIAKGNALNYKLYFDNLKNQNDMDPVRKQNAEIAEAFKAMPDHDVQEMSAEAARAAIQDPQNPVFAHTHLVLPGGFRPVVDENGNPVKDAQGNPKSEGFVYVVGGMKDGKVALPGSLVDDAKKYGALGGATGAENLTEGLEMDASAFIKLYNAVNAGKVAAAKGWTTPDLSEAKDGNIIQHNLVTGEQKPATSAQTQKFQMDKATLEEKRQQTRTGRATEIEKYAQAKKAMQDGTGTDADRAVIAESIRKGRMDPSQLSKRSKDYNAVLAEADRQEMEETGQHFNIAQAQTDYRYANNAQTKNTLNMINGMAEPGGAIEIAQQQASKLPGLNSKTINKIFNATATEFGDPSLSDFHTAMLGLADEYSKVMGGGVSSDTGRQQALDILKEAYSKGQMAGAVDIMRRDIAARKKAIIGSNRYLLQEYGDSQGSQPQNQQTQNATQPPANTVHMQKPDGSFIYVPSANVAAAQKLGAKVVQ